MPRSMINLALPVLFLGTLVAAESPTPAHARVQPTASSGGFLGVDPTVRDGLQVDHWHLRSPWRASLPLADLRQGGGLVVWWCPMASQPLEIRVTVGGTPSWSATVIVAGHGWRRIRLPLRALDQGAAQDLPAGATVQFDVVGTAPAQASLAIAGLRVTPDATEVRGSNLTDEDLLAQINWDYPALAEGRALLRRGDRTGALKVLVTHVRRRTPTWPANPPPSPERAQRNADGILAGRLEVLNLKHTYPGGAIDWLHNPTTGASASHEWVWSLNRHATWVQVARAFQATGQAKYAEGWVRLMRSWVDQVPAPGTADERAGSAWRDIEAGLRVSRPWFESFYGVLASPAVTDQDVVEFLKAVWDHGNFLAVAEFNPTNHFVFAMTGLYTAGAQFPEFRDAARWRSTASRQLSRSLQGSVLGEGGWYELSPGYGAWVNNKVQDMWDYAVSARQTQEIDPALKATLGRMAEWGVRLAGPDGTVPMVNDGGPLRLQEANFERLVHNYPKSVLLPWIRDVFGGVERPAGPTWTSERLPDSGYAIMRTGWGRAESYLLLDTGPMGGWHGHQDALNVVAFFHGRYFLFDNGGYKYDKSAWRAWGPSTAAHNTVLVDGMGQLRTWHGDQDPIGSLPKEQPPARFGTSPAADYASGWYVCGYGTDVPDRGQAMNVVRPAPATHHREVLLVKSLPSPMAVILDTMTPADQEAHRYQVRWHLKSTVWQHAAEGAITWTADPGQPNLAVVALGGTDTHQADSGVKKPEILGWWFEGQNAAPTPALTLRRDRESVGTTRILTLLVPFTGDPSVPPVTVESRAEGVWTVRRQGQAKPVTIRLRPMGEQPGVQVDGVELPPLQ